MKYALFLILFLIVSCADNSVDPAYNTVIPTAQTELVNVNFVYDGDTFSANFNGTDYKVRVINIDTYESSKSSDDLLERLTKQANAAKISVDSALKLGIKAKKFADSILDGKTITVERRNYSRNIDVYGRLLRYVIVNGMKYDSLIKANGLNSKL